MQQQQDKEKKLKFWLEQQFITMAAILSATNQPTKFSDVEGVWSMMSVLKSTNQLRDKVGAQFFIWEGRTKMINKKKTTKMIRETPYLPFYQKRKKNIKRKKLSNFLMQILRSKIFSLKTS